jgi:hypothetical protein
MKAPNESPFSTGVLTPVLKGKMSGVKKKLSRDLIFFLRKNH